MLKALTNLGLSPEEASVYIHIASHGPTEFVTMADALNLDKDKLNKIIETLEEKQIIASKPQSDIFFALPFAQVFEILIKTHKKDTQEIEQSREKIISKWKRIIKN